MAGLRGSDVGPHGPIIPVDDADLRGRDGRSIEPKSFLVIVAVATLAFAWMLWSFLGAVFWAVVIAIVFDPMHARLLRLLAGRRN